MSKTVNYSAQHMNSLHGYASKLKEWGSPPPTQHACSVCMEHKCRFTAWISWTSTLQRNKAQRAQLLAQESSQPWTQFLELVRTGRWICGPARPPFLLPDRYGLKRSLILPLTCESLKIHMSVAGEGKLGCKENMSILQVRSALGFCTSCTQGISRTECNSRLPPALTLVLTGTFSPLLPWAKKSFQFVCFPNKK